MFSIFRGFSYKHKIETGKSPVAIKHPNMAIEKNAKLENKILPFSIDFVPTNFAS